MRRLAPPEAGLGASEAVSGEAAAPEMAGSERRGLGRGSPAEWGQGLLLLLLWGSCSGRIHRLALTVRPAAGRSGAGGARLSQRSPRLKWSRPTSPAPAAGWSGPAPPTAGRVVPSRDPPLSPRMELPGRPRWDGGGRGAPSPGTPTPALSPLNSWGALAPLEDRGGGGPWTLPGVPGSFRSGGASRRPQIVLLDAQIRAQGIQGHAVLGPPDGLSRPAPGLSEHRGPEPRGAREAEV